MRGCRPRRGHAGRSWQQLTGLTSVSLVARRPYRSLLAGLIVAGITSRVRRELRHSGAARDRAAPSAGDHYAVKEQASAAPSPPTYRWVIVIALTGAAVISLFIVGIAALGKATSTPLAPLPDGGLYLYVDRPGVTASIDVVVQSSREDKPSFSASISLNDSKTRFALIGQGPWAITGSSIEHPGGFVPNSASLLPHATPSVIMIGRAGNL
jgi:hypothetical protein